MLLSITNKVSSCMLASPRRRHAMLPQVGCFRRTHPAMVAFIDCPDESSRDGDSGPGEIPPAGSVVHRMNTLLVASLMLTPTMELPKYRATPSDDTGPSSGVARGPEPARPDRPWLQA